MAVNLKGKHTCQMDYELPEQSPVLSTCCVQPRRRSAAKTLPFTQTRWSFSQLILPEPEAAMHACSCRARPVQMCLS